MFNDYEALAMDRERSQDIRKQVARRAASRREDTAGARAARAYAHPPGSCSRSHRARSPAKRRAPLPRRGGAPRGAVIDTGPRE